MKKKKKSKIELINCCGMLNEHDVYVEMLNRLQKDCKYIDIILIDTTEEDNQFVKKFRDDIIYIKKAKNNIVRFRATDDFFQYLKKFETFCKNYITEKYGDYVEYTDFGIDDIYFYDDGEIPMLNTETHEGIVCVRNDLVE